MLTCSTSSDAELRDFGNDSAFLVQMVKSLSEVAFLIVKLKISHLRIAVATNLQNRNC